MTLLSSTNIESRLSSLPGFHLNKGAIEKTYEFSDFREAMSFVNAIATLAERAGHHPDIDIRYNKVTVAIASHDAGGITEKDFSLAKEIAAVI